MSRPRLASRRLASRRPALVRAAVTTLAALTVGLGFLSGGVAVAAPTQVAGPATFSPAQILGPYPSDYPPGGTYVPVLDGFDHLRDNRPDIIAQNLDTAVRINNSATKAQQADAIAINYDDRLISLSEGLGTKLGPEFRRLLADGQIPKVAALTEGYTARAMLPLGTTLIEKEIFGNPRPFVAAPGRIERYNRPGEDLYADLGGNGSYPSGHTSMGYLFGGMLAYWLPELGPQIIARAGEIGLGRIVLGVHYPLDVMGGRILATDLLTARLRDPGFAALIDQAGQQLRAQLERAVGMPLARFIAADTPYLSSQQAVQAHRQMMTYGFDRITPQQRNEIPASAALLLKSRFPHLTDAQRLDIIRRTAISSGYPLDKAGSNGGWLRIDLAAAYAVVP
ncbi:phosphatase PAP2 family protein [Gordonia sp. HNM0687]|uniref:acid phosphatase n=1 Tax=Gordonia mangrovi TaxID=2665643 RepID=A0A6L7GJ14_9ACTN|nr:phosphatase PAP2 family protein [Gordonia mangrovi]UVF80629.1 phosphatase PAP2 family protein [Gordonia mangrovi]